MPDDYVAPYFQLRETPLIKDMTANKLDPKMDHASSISSYKSHLDKAFRAQIQHYDSIWVLWCILL